MPTIEMTNSDVLEDLVDDVIQRLRTHDGQLVEKADAVRATKNAIAYVEECWRGGDLASPAKALDPIFHAVSLNPAWPRFLRSKGLPLLMHQPTGKAGGFDGYERVRAAAALALGNEFMPELWPEIGRPDEPSALADCVLFAPDEPSALADCVLFAPDEPLLHTTIFDAQRLREEFEFDVTTQAEFSASAAAAVGLPDGVDVSHQAGFELVARANYAYATATTTD